MTDTEKESAAVDHVADGLAALFALTSGGYLALSPHARGNRFYQSLVGRSKYTFQMLPAIRAREVNFRGERQR